MSVTIEAENDPKGCIILLGNMSESTREFEYFPKFIKTACPEGFKDLDFIIPQPPLMELHLPIAPGVELSSWYDMFGIDAENFLGIRDTPGLIKAVDIVKELILEEIEDGVPPEKIIIGGYSQGAAVTLAVASTIDIKLGGFFALAGGLYCNEELKKHSSMANIDTPILQCHGQEDPLMSAKDSFECHTELKKAMGFTNYTFISYEGLTHIVSPIELFDILQLVKKVLHPEI